MRGLDSPRVPVDTASAGLPNCDDDDDSSVGVAALLVSDPAANARLHISHNSLQFMQIPSQDPTGAMPTRLYLRTTATALCVLAHSTIGNSKGGYLLPTDLCVTHPSRPSAPPILTVSSSEQAADPADPAATLSAPRASAARRLQTLTCTTDFLSRGDVYAPFAFVFGADGSRTHEVTAALDFYQITSEELACRIVQDDEWACLDIATHETMATAEAGGQLFGQTCANGEVYGDRRVDAHDAKAWSKRA